MRFIMAAIGVIFLFLSLQSRGQEPAVQYDEKDWVEYEKSFKIQYLESIAEIVKNDFENPHHIAKEVMRIYQDFQLDKERRYHFSSQNCFRQICFISAEQAKKYGEINGKYVARLIRLVGIENYKRLYEYEKKIWREEVEKNTRNEPSVINFGLH